MYNGSIAWNGGGKILYWDGSRDIDNSPIVEQISGDNVSTCSLYDGAIAWIDYGSLVKGMYYWDGSRDINNAPVIQVIKEGYGLNNPSLHGGSIAWNEFDTDNEIFYWDGTTIHQITNNSYNDLDPSLYNGNISWQTNRLGQYDIYYYDLNSKPVANAGDSQVIPVCDAVRLDGKGSSDTDGTIVSWEWYLEYQGDSSLNKSATGETTTVSDLSVGFYDVTLVVTDDLGVIGNDTMLLEVEEQNSWDVDGDCRQGLGEVIYILQKITGQ